MLLRRFYVQENEKGKPVARVFHSWFPGSNCSSTRAQTEEKPDAEY